MGLIERWFGSEGEAIVSYRTLRRVVGILGIALPVVMMLWGFALMRRPHIEPSISDYYRLRTRDAFVGILFTIGWFLFTYRGYDRRDSRAGNVACVCALAVALFPVTGTRGEVVVHFASATLLFLTLAYFSLGLFTQSSGAPTPRKLVRNRIYRTCGAIMLVCIALIAVAHRVLSAEQLAGWSPVFWLESIALWAFGLSWFVKGDTLFRDVPP